MSRILRTPKAEEDLFAIWDHIALEAGKPLAAESLLRRIDEACDTLSGQPMIGQALDQVHSGLRFFTVGNYVLLYRPLQDGILVYRVLHGARNWQELL